jgi:hypothetical protein
MPHFTTNSPQKYHALHALFPKYPSKTPAKTTKLQPKAPDIFSGKITA